MDESTIGLALRPTDGWGMDKALVSCGSCERTWHSQTMADGLRTVGRCPRCGGELRWHADAGHARASVSSAGEGQEDVAPHLVLGVPRR
jgi:hypothetical protein